MESTNGRPVQSLGPDFNAALQEAQQTGDFAFVIKTAKESQEMIRSFHEAVVNASYPGKYASAVAMGVNLLQSMVSQSAAQLEMLKRTEKVTREAIKAAQKNPPKLDVVEPEAQPVPEAPSEAAGQPEPPPVSAKGEGWDVPPEDQHG